MNAGLGLRAGDLADREFVLATGLRVAHTSVSSLRPHASQGAVEMSFRQLMGVVFARDHDVVIATMSEAPVGFAAVIYDLPEEITLTPQAFLAYMAVAPEFQGRGIGKALLFAVEQLAARRKIGHVSLMVTAENEAARKLYARAGFAPERMQLTKSL